MTHDDLKTEAQSVLDDLWATQLIPFELTAHKVESLGADEYIIRFHDSRLRSVDVSWKNQDSFKDVVRAAVLNRVARMSGSK
jgi:hypothetical protein